MTEYAHLEVDLEPEMEAEIKAEAKAMKLPENGVLLMKLLGMGIADGTIDPANLMSAQDLLAAMADKIEQDGVHEDNVFDLVAKLRILSLFATTAPVPVRPLLRPREMTERR